MNTDEIAAAVAQAQQGEPASRWAVLTELGLVAALEQFPAPRMIVFLDDPTNDPSGLLSLTLETPADQITWCRWFGAEWFWSGQYISTRPRIVWRGWAVQLASRPATAYERDCIDRGRPLAPLFGSVWQ